MKKRIIRLSLVLALMLCLSVSVFAESQLWHITDDAGILTESQNIELETYAETISQDYGVGVYVVTVDNYEDYYDSAYETAWQIYHAYELGEGADRDGVILLLSMDNRQFATFFYGPRAEYAFDKHGQEKLEDYFLDHFRADDWANGIYGFLSGCDEFLSLAASGTPVPQPLGHHRHHRACVVRLLADRLHAAARQDEIRPHGAAGKRLCLG